MTDFLAMGGYALYVWPAYGISLITLVLSIVLPIRQHNRLRAEISVLASQRNEGGSP
ncbi:MAG: heme exporter protein CcmD [Gammaproteobacteria bacterium]